MKAKLFSWSANSEMNAVEERLNHLLQTSTVACCSLSVSNFKTTLAVFYEETHPNVNDIKISTLGLSARPYNSLTNANIDTVGQLRVCSKHYLVHLRNFGTKSLRECRDKLAALGIKVHWVD